MQMNSSPCHHLIAPIEEQARISHAEQQSQLLVGLDIQIEDSMVGDMMTRNARIHFF